MSRASRTSSKELSSSGRSVFWVSYEGANGMHVMDAMRSLGTWLVCSDNNYLLSSSESLGDVQHKLDGAISRGSDKLLILELKVRRGAGWTTREGWSWLHAHGVDDFI